MIESATVWGRKTLERAREQGDGIATEVRKRVIEPVGEGLSAGADATAARVKRSGGDPRVTAPMIAVAGFVGAIGEFFLDPQSGRRRRAATRDRIATLIRRSRGQDEKPLGDGAPSMAIGHAQGKAKHQAAIRSK
jgi:hypothetical protein